MLYLTVKISDFEENKYDMKFQVRSLKNDDDL